MIGYLKEFSDQTGISFEVVLTEKPEKRASMVLSWFQCRQLKKKKSNMDSILAWKVLKCNTVSLGSSLKTNIWHGLQTLLQAWNKYDQGQKYRPHKITYYHHNWLPIVSKYDIRCGRTLVWKESLEKAPYLKWRKQKLLWLEQGRGLQPRSASPSPSGALTTLPSHLLWSPMHWTICQWTFQTE